MVAIAVLVVVFLARSACARRRRRLRAAGRAAAAARQALAGRQPAALHRRRDRRASASGSAFPPLLADQQRRRRRQQAVGGVDLTATQAQGPRALRRELRDLPHAAGVQLRRRHVGPEPRRAAPRRRALVRTRSSRARPRQRQHAGRPADRRRRQGRRRLRRRRRRSRSRQITAPGSPTTARPPRRASARSAAAPPRLRRRRRLLRWRPLHPRSGGSSQASAAGEGRLRRELRQLPHPEERHRERPGRAEPRHAQSPMPRPCRSRCSTAAAGCRRSRRQLTDKQIADVAAFVAATAGS